MAANGGCERDVLHRMNEGYRAWGALKSVLSGGSRMKEKKCLYQGFLTRGELGEMEGLQGGSGRPGKSNINMSNTSVFSILSIL